MVEKLMLQAYVISQKLTAGPRAAPAAPRCPHPGAFQSSPASARLELFGPETSQVAYVRLKRKGVYAYW